MALSKISVDLKNRTFDVEVEQQDLAQVLDMLNALFLEHVSLENGPEPVDQESPARPDGDTTPLQTEDSSKRAKRRTKASRGPSKIRAYETVDLGLSAEQKQILKDFYSERQPTGQNNTVATLALKLRDLKEQATFNANEIYSAFKVLNKPAPRNLVAVFGNMKRDGIAGYDNQSVIVNSFTEDHVMHHMHETNKK